MVHASDGFLVFNVENIRGFTSNFVAIFSSNSYLFGFLSRIKIPPLDILKFLVATLSNQDNKVAFVIVDEYLSLARSYEFMKTCYNINIIVQNTGRDESSLNGKTKSPNKTLSNIRRALLIK